MTKKLKILVVDDEDAIRNLLVRIISKSHPVKGAENGEVAIDLARLEKFDVAFLDMKMPGIDGLDTMRELRKIHPDLTVVIITGYAENDRLEQALKEGAIACLKKPFQLDEIRDIIQSQTTDIVRQGPLRVLAVDDDLMFRKLFDQLNQFESYIIKTVGNAAEALAAIKAETFDVIFIDIVLPDEDGFKLQEEVRRISADIKIVFFTGIEEFFEQMRVRIKEGVRYSLRKPFDVTAVRQVLEQIEKDMDSK